MATTASSKSACKPSPRSARRPSSEIVLPGADVAERLGVEAQPFALAQGVSGPDPDWGSLTVRIASSIFSFSDA
jgi:hypothetical protein